MTMSIERLVDLLRQPGVSRDEAIDLIRRHGEYTALMATHLVWDQVLGLLEFSKLQASKTAQ
jgi:hypothetical protein